MVFSLNLEVAHLLWRSLSQWLIDRELKARVCVI